MQNSSKLLRKDNLSQKKVKQKKEKVDSLVIRPRVDGVVAPLERDGLEDGTLLPRAHFRLEILATRFAPPEHTIARTQQQRRRRWWWWWWRNTKNQLSTAR